MNEQYKEKEDAVWRSVEQASPWHRCFKCGGIIDLGADYLCIFLHEEGLREIRFYHRECTSVEKE